MGICDSLRRSLQSGDRNPYDDGCATVTRAAWDEQEKNLEVDYPSIDAAFQFVLPSYQMMMARFDAADSRTQTLLGLAGGFTGGILALAKGQAWNAAAAVALITLFLMVACVTIARVLIQIEIPDPGRIHNKHLVRGPLEFKRYLIEAAGRSFTNNSRKLFWRSRLSDIVLVGFVIEISVVLVILRG